MLLQEQLIMKVKELGGQTPGVNAIMMYGSFTQGSGDAFSDIEFYIFIEDESYKSFSSKAWVAGICPFYIHLINEFGTEVFIFENLVRGEFHFLPVTDMPIIETFAAVGFFPDVNAMCLYDKNNTLKQHLSVLKNSMIERNSAESIESVINNYFNAILFGINVLKRGETARSLECLWYVQKYYLQLIRLEENTTDHWVNPTKCLEDEILAANYQRYQKCTSDLNENNLRSAYKELLFAAREVVGKLSSRYSFNYDYELFQRLIDYIEV